MKYDQFIFLPLRKQIFIVIRFVLDEYNLSHTRQID